jgi:hypothetical protein
MALAQRVGNDYINVHIEGGGRAILGNVYGQSSDERALAAILDSLSYAGMTDRRDTVAEAQDGTFDWTFLEGTSKLLKKARRILKGCLPITSKISIWVSSLGWKQTTRAFSV